MQFGEAFLSLIPQLDQRAVGTTQREAHRAGERVGKEYAQGVDKGASKGTGSAGAFGTALATLGAKATIGAAGVGAMTPAVLQLTAAVLPATGALLAYPAALLAIKAVSATTKFAVMGVGDAIKEGFGDDPKKAAAALKELTPEARKFAKSVIELQGPLDKLQGRVAGRFFEPLNGGFDQFVNAYLPVANREVPKLADALGVGAAQFASAATKGQLFKGVSSLLENTTTSAQMLSAESTSITDGLGSILLASSRTLPTLAEGFNNGAVAAGGFLTQAEKSGQLDRWFAAGIATIAQLVAILKNLGTVVAQVLKAASASSGDFLGTIVSLTAQMAAFFKSVEGNQALTNFFTVTGAISTALRQGLMLVLPQIVDALRIMAPAVAPLVGSFLQLVGAVAPLIPVAARLAVVVASVLAGAMSTLATALAPVIANLTGSGSAGTGMADLTASAEKLGPALNDAAASVSNLTPALNLTASAIAFLVDHTDTIIKFLPLIVAGFIAWKVAQLAANIAMAASVPIRIAEIIATRQQTAALLANATALGVATGTQTTNTTVTLGARIATAAQAVATGVATAATWLWTAATTALGVAIKFAMGPVGLIIIGITALIAIIVLAYKHNETFRAIVDAVWKGIKTAISATVDWFVNTAWPALKKAVDFLGDVFTWLWKNIIQPVWTGIKVAIDVAWAVIKVIFAAIEAYVRVVAAIFTWLWKNIIEPVWKGIYLAIQVAWKLIEIVFKIIEIAVRALGMLFEWLWKNVIVPVWNAITAVIRAQWALISAVFNAIMTFVRGVFAATWNWLSALISTVWNAIKTAVSAAWNWLKDNVFNPVINFFKSVFGPAWEAMKGVVTRAWDGIKGPIQATWNWVKSNVFEPINKFITSTIPNAFSTGVSAIGKAWDKIKDAAKVPVKFVIETVLNKGIIAGINWIAKKVGASEISPIPLPFATGGVLPGYTPGRDVHRFVSATGGALDLSGGEAIMRPEFTRAVGPAFIDAANRAARGRGTGGVRDFMTGFMKYGDSAQYADGGIFGGIKDKIGGAASWVWDKTKDVASGVSGGIAAAWDAFTNPVETFKKMIGSMLGGVGGAEYGDILKGASNKLIDGVAEWISAQFAKFGGGMGGEGGPGNWSAMFQWVKSRFPYAQLFSGLRNSTTLSGNKSLHASGRAIDVTPNREISRAIIGTFGKNITELISPWKEDHVWHGQRPHDYGYALDAQHGVYGNNAHIHWAMKNGGVFKKYDKGGWFNPGDIGVNKLRRPEAVLTPEESTGLKALGTDEISRKLDELIAAIKDNGHVVGGYIKGSGKGMITRARQG